MENTLSPSAVEWEQFLYDVRDYFKASLETSDYENASNMFFVTAAEATEQLLTRCEQLLAQCAALKQENDILKSSNKATKTDIIMPIIPETNHELEDTSYLDMTATGIVVSSPKENIDDVTTFEVDSCKVDSLSQSCIKKLNMAQENILHDEDDDDDDPDIYDICHVTQISVDERQKVINHESEHQEAHKDCPYKDLPAGHLTIHKSTKYGQLQRIEKRLFFDQSKKYYCGILQDWLLCYAEGPTSSQPSSTLYLKSPGIDIEHSGEGKRRDICFQITTADPNKKFIFQANNEVDAKEWIHAIEAAIRGDSGTLLKTTRKLPTPPMIKKLVFVGVNSNHHHHVKMMTTEASGNSDYIYEEPSPLYHLDKEKTTEPSGEPPQLPEKPDHATVIAMKYENYDVPKCPPQPLKINSNTNNIGFGPIESETVGLLNGGEPESTLVAINTQQQQQQQQQHQQNQQQQQLNRDNLNDKQDFQAKLSSQLAAGPKKAVKKNNSWCDSDSICLTNTTIPVLSAKDQKKQKKSNTPNSSPHKNCITNNMSNNNNNNSNNNNNNQNSAEKSAKNWFLNRINGSMRNSTTTNITSPTKCKQSEKENLLNGLEITDNFDCVDSNTSPQQQQQQQNGSSPIAPILKSLPANNNSGKSKVNMIINKFESSGNGHMFSVEALASNALASFSAFCESNDCGNYEPIMTSPTLSSFMKKV